MQPQSSNSNRLLEAFRGLRSQLLLHLREGQKTILVTSARPAEGKSVVAANLALVTAAAGKSVVLIDGDLRNPNLHKLFGVENRLGLRNVLEGRCLTSDALAKAAEGLSLLPAGSFASDSERVLSQPSTALTMSALKETFDFLIVDAPAALSCPDAELLARHCDGVLLVLGAGQTLSPEIRLVRERLEGAGARILGSVLNGVDASDELMYSGPKSVARPDAKTVPSNTEVLSISRAAGSVDR